MDEQDGSRRAVRKLCQRIVRIVSVKLAGGDSSPTVNCGFTAMSHVWCRRSRVSVRQVARTMRLAVSAGTTTPQSEPHTLLLWLRCLEPRVHLAIHGCGTLRTMRDLRGLKASCREAPGCESAVVGTRRRTPAVSMRADPEPEG